MKFFKYFPQVNYNNLILTNLCIRLALKKLIKSNGKDLYDYRLKNDDRPDIIAHKYYGDSNMEWLIYLANDIINPYHQWPLSEYNFIKYIEEKYGSVSSASSQIIHYKDEDGYIVDQYTYSTLSGNKTTVNAFEYEQELNDAKMNIKLVSDERASQIRLELEKILNTYEKRATYYKRYPQPIELV